MHMRAYPVSLRLEYSNWVKHAHGYQAYRRHNTSVALLSVMFVKEAVLLSVCLNLTPVATPDF
jgi:hypothetical protein